MCRLQPHRVAGAPVERGPRLGPGRRGLGALCLAYALLVGVRVGVRVRVRVPWPPHVAPREANPNPTPNPNLRGKEGELLLGLAPLRAPGESSLSGK